VGSSIARKSEQLQSQQRLQNTLGMARRPQLPGPTEASAAAVAELPDQLPDIELEADETLWAVFEYQQPDIYLHMARDMSVPSTQGEVESQYPFSQEQAHHGQWEQGEMKPDAGGEFPTRSLWNLIHKTWLGRLPPVKIYLTGNICLGSYDHQEIGGALEIGFGKIEYEIQVEGENLDLLVEAQLGEWEEEGRHQAFLKEELKYALPLDKNDEYIEMISKLGDVEFSDSFVEVMTSLSQIFDEAHQSGAEQLIRVTKLIRSAVKTAADLETQAEEQDRENEWEDEDEDEDDEDLWGDPI